MRRRFLVTSLEGGRAIVGGDDARHLGLVLRARIGQQFELSDGKDVWLGSIVEVRRGEVEFRLSEPVANPGGSAAIEVALLLSIVRFARFEWALEKATELGAAAIQPVAAARSESGLIAAAPKRSARWQKIVREAAAQSRRLRPPELFPVAGATEALVKSGAQVKVLLSERAGAAPIAKFRPKVTPPSVALAFGPEGGWTEEEFETACRAGFGEASLGSRILRTETAVTAALAVVLCGWTE